MLSRGLLIVLLTAGFAAHARWSISRLAGKRSYHAGPNCYNATLAAKGYVDELRYSDGVELREYLERFCTPRSGRPSPGDVLAVIEAGTLSHAGIALGAQTLFDKNSTVGFLDGTSDAADSAYGSRAFAKSEWFTGCAPSVCHVEAYVCADAPIVRAQTLRCDEVARGLGLIELGLLFEDYAMSPSARGFEASVEPRLARLATDLRSVNANDECARPLLARSLSLFTQWILVKQSVPWTWTTALQDLRDRILAVDHSPSTARILNESSWPPFADPAEVRARINAQ